MSLVSLKTKFLNAFAFNGKVGFLLSDAFFREEPNSKIRICETEQCIRSAANLRLSMDPSVDPCDDFYEFTCGRWTSEHPDHGWFSMYSSFALIEEKITFASLKYFQSNVSKEEPFAVKQSRDMFQACLDTG